MTFDLFVLPFFLGLIFLLVVLGIKYTRWINALPKADIVKIRNGIFSRKFFLSIREIFFESLIHRKMFKQNALSGWMHMVKSTKPVIAVGATRTGCGKSQTSRRIIELLMAKGLKVVAVRHPMPYGDLNEQKVQRFATIADLKKHKCTIEEMEEYEPHAGIYSETHRTR